MKNNRWIVQFESPEASSDVDGIALVGGKGSNLARMAQADFPVPDGFFVSTLAYLSFVSENHLENEIRDTCLPIFEDDDPERLEAASTKIRALFTKGIIPSGLSEEIIKAYRAIDCPAVAVRSSATAEDMPEMSFAGQQDTYLNVVGDGALLEAVVECWGSLWTARAIGYRNRNQVDAAGVSLAVVVQRMVASDVSGVLFTANPLSGLRCETVIDATYGLGEALVSGQVEPDHYLVNTQEQKIKTKILGAKALSIHGKDGGGTTTTTINRKHRQALSDIQILSLADLGQRVAKYYGTPQDIEWALTGDRIYLLQARPVTSLFPIPERLPPNSLEVFISFGAVQGMLAPFTPAGRDALRLVFAKVSRLFGYHYQAETQRILYEGGERLWINITPLIRNTIGRKITRGALSFGESTIEQALIQVWDEPGLQPQRRGIQPRAMLRIVQAFVPFLCNMLLNLSSPRKRRENILAGSEALIRSLQTAAAAIHGDARAMLAQQANLLDVVSKRSLPYTFLRFISLIASGMASFNMLRVLALQIPEEKKHAQSGGWPRSVLEIVRGMPNNPTTEMDLALWRMAREIQSSEALRSYFQQSSQTLADLYCSKAMLPAAQELIEPFMERYGDRGLAEIDMGRPRWKEDPQHIFDVLSGYLRIQDDEQAPDAAFARGAVAAQAAIDHLCAELRKQRGGRFKAHMARLAAGRVRELFGARESPKFFAVRMLSTVRYALLSTGKLLAEESLIEHSDDLLFLSFSEMRVLASDDTRDWKGLIAQRRSLFQREMLRRQVPRLLLSDGRAFYEGMRPVTESDSMLTGSPVSPGTVEGRVRVVLDPRKANLHPGEIMVCPGTDPSWTPLFLTAAGLVMEVGGMMTHGAVVAREYGIPAVVGVDQATSRLADGQRIRMDGSSGFIALLDENDEP